MSIVKKAVIPAAGLGTRFLPVTKALPKEMLPIIDTPVIQYVIEEAVASGIKDIIIITGRGKRAIEDYFDQSFELEFFLNKKGQSETSRSLRRISDMADIHYIRQKEPLGLGHAVLQAGYHIGDEPFAILLGDEIFHGSVPVLKQLIECYEKTGASVLAVQPVEKSEINNYGIIKPHQEANGLIKVIDLVEKPDLKKAPSNLAIVGRYVIEPQIFDVLKNTAPGVNGEIQLTDALQNMMGIRDIFAIQIQGKRYDVGSKFGYLQATVEFGLAREDLGPQFRELLRKLKILDDAKF